MKPAFHHPAEVYRSLRAKFFAIASKHSFKTAFYVLEKETEEGKIDPLSFKGLLGELIFAKDNGNSLDLIPTLDAGDHCDFVGQMKGGLARFDVTTNLDVKQLSTYEPYQKTGKKYFIVLVNEKQRKVEKIVDINFPFCSICGGRLVNILLVGQLQETEGGSPAQTQRVIKVCSSNKSHKKVVRDFDYYLPSIQDEWEYYKELFYDGEIEEKEAQLELKKRTIERGVNNSLLFSKHIGDKINAVGENHFFFTYKDEGDYATRLYWRSDLVDQLVPEKYDDLLDDFDISN
jgi:hypothetical protein